MQRVCFDIRKACSRLVEGKSVRLDRVKTSRTLLEVWRVRYEHSESCIRLAQLLNSVLSTASRVAGLKNFGESVYTTAKCLETFFRSSKCLFDHSKACRGLVDVRRVCFGHH